MEPTIKKRFWSYVTKTSGCWVWNGGLSGGYGGFRVGEKEHRAHRLSFEMSKGKIPDGMCVCHTCDNPACVRPAHLFIGTHLENARDRVSKGRNRNQDGEKNNKAKLTEEKVRLIRSLYEKGYNQKMLASQFGVGQDNVSRVVNHKIWTTT